MTDNAELTKSHLATGLTVLTRQIIELETNSGALTAENTRLEKALTHLLGALKAQTEAQTEAHDELETENTRLRAELADLDKAREPDVSMSDEAIRQLAADRAEALATIAVAAERFAEELPRFFGRIATNFIDLMDQIKAPN